MPKTIFSLLKKLKKLGAMIQKLPCYDTKATLGAKKARHNAGSRHFLKSIYIVDNVDNVCVCPPISWGRTTPQSRKVRKKREKTEKKLKISKFAFSLSKLSRKIF